MKKLRKTPEEYDEATSDLAAVITDMKMFFMTKRLESGYFCFREAFIVNPYAHNAQDTERIVAKTEELEWRKFRRMDKFGKYAVYMILGIAVMVLGVVILNATVLS